MASGQTLAYRFDVPRRDPPSDRILLILDLDETLIHARTAPLDRPADFELFGYHIYLRPHLAEFLDRCARHYELAVWSSASDDYVAAVVERIVPENPALHFAWGRSRATLRRLIGPDEADFFVGPDHLHYLKPLTKVARRGWPLERILIVDDTPAKCRRNYGNAIYVQPFEGDPDDVELKLLAAYLEELKDCGNVRRIEKRGWRARATAALG